MYRQRESAKGNHKQPATGKNEVQRHFRRTIPTDREGGKKDKVLCDRLLLSAREILTNAKLCNLMEITTKTG